MYTGVCHIIFVQGCTFLECCSSNTFFRICDAECANCSIFCMCSICCSPRHARSGTPGRVPLEKAVKAATWTAFCAKTLCSSSSFKSSIVLSTVAFASARISPKLSPTWTTILLTFKCRSKLKEEFGKIFPISKAKILSSTLRSWFCPAHLRIQDWKIVFSRPGIGFKSFSGSIWIWMRIPWFSNWLQKITWGWMWAETLPSRSSLLKTTWSDLFWRFFIWYCKPTT